MKNIILSATLIISLLVISCNEDFLEKPPSVDVTEDIIFSKMAEAETFVAGTYKLSIPYGYPADYGSQHGINQRINGGILASICDEAEMGNGWTSAHDWNNGAITPNAITSEEDDRFEQRWRAVRRCNILMERIGAVPDATEEYKSQVNGEAHFIRALLYFETVKRYGGVPIVSNRLNASDELLLPRRSLKACIDFIVDDCDMAISLLPAIQPSNMRGRAHKGAALALKARTLLYAASPLFNSATSYLDFSGNDSLICYGNYDKNRWQLAADAAKATLDWASSNGCSLVDGYGVDRNYLMVTEEQDNKEIILANKAFAGIGQWDNNTYGIITPKFARGWSNGGVSVPLNFIKFYEKKDGGKQDWKMEGGNNLLQMYAELDPRFKQTIAYHKSPWNQHIGILNMVDGSVHRNFCPGSHWMHKTIPTDLLWNAPIMNWIVFRLGEVYLNYAEALNEAGTGPDARAYEAVNLIRARSGMPPLPSGLDQAQFRERVRNERAVELSFEEHRFWDIRRWKIADQDGVMKGDFYGLSITPVGGGSSEFKYLPTVFETRVWYDKMYLHPFPIGEIYKGYLVQNPGWQE